MNKEDPTSYLKRNSTEEEIKQFDKTYLYHNAVGQWVSWEVHRCVSPLVYKLAQDEAPRCFFPTLLLSEMDPYFHLSVQLRP